MSKTLIKLKKIRKKLGWTLEKMAKEIGVGTTMIWRIERGDIPRENNLKKIEKFLTKVKV